MGKKRERKGKRLFLYSACLLTLLLLSAGCATGLSSHKRQKEGNRHLDQAEKLMGKGDYEGALKEDMSAIALLAGVTPGDRALFHMGLIWAHPENPQRDYNKALGYFQKVAIDFPDSALTGEARVLEGALKEILLREGRIKEAEETVNALTKQLNDLKETMLRESRIKEGEDTVNALTKQLNSLKETQSRIEEKNKRLEESVRTLTKQLNAMKEIDLGIEEKKREDTPVKTNR